MPPHSSLVNTFEMILDPSVHKFYIVMEKMDMSLIDLMDSRRKRAFSCENVKLILYQILLGIAHIHDNHFFHRDIKPENILITRVNAVPRKLFDGLRIGVKSNSDQRKTTRLSKVFSGPLEPPPPSVGPPRDSSSFLVKLTDFGLARETTLKASFTSYVSTRWYRAPEILLRAGVYGPPVDVWAFGAMTSEISSLSPLFPGKNEANQLELLIKGLGTPSSRNVGGRWAQFKTLSKKIDIEPVKVGRLFFFFFVQKYCESSRLLMNNFRQLLQLDQILINPTLVWNT